MPAAPILPTFDPEDTAADLADAIQAHKSAYAGSVQPPDPTPLFTEHADGSVTNRVGVLMRPARAEA